MAGLQRISEDLSLPYTKVEEDGSMGSESPSSDKEQTALDNESMTTVIVPALGVDMSEPYSDRKIKLLALNVNTQVSILPSIIVLTTSSHPVVP